MLPIKAPVKVCLLEKFDELLKHDGFGTLKVDMRLLRRGQKEIIIDCGKQYRFVVDFQPAGPEAAGLTSPNIAGTHSSEYNAIKP